MKLAREIAEAAGEELATAKDRLIYCTRRELESLIAAKLGPVRDALQGCVRELTDLILKEEVDPYVWHAAESALALLED